VVLQRDATGKITPVPVEPGGLALALPMVVLINGGTASGAEIVAGALQDVHRADLVGEKTFGTGTVLQAFPLSDGSALMLAIEEWRTPGGQVIWHRGILPDRVVSLPADITPSIPEREKGMTVSELQASGDKQLLRALELLLQPEGEPSRNKEMKAPRPKEHSFLEGSSLSIFSQTVVGSRDPVHWKSAVART
jgi:carboxyl-terminal processing protease